MSVRKIPNPVLRHVREVERQETRAEFAEAMARKAKEIEESVAPTERYVARLEDGDIRYPYPAYRRVLTALCGRSMAELGFTSPLAAKHGLNMPDPAYAVFRHTPESARMSDPLIPTEPSTPQTDILAGYPSREPGSEPALLYSAGDDGEDIMRRRAFLLNAAILAGISRVDLVTALEAARQGLNDSFPSRHDADVSEWGEIAWDYGETYPVTAPAELIGTLLTDFAGLGEAFRRYPQDAAQQELYRASALLAGFLAQTVNNLGHVNEARRWWRTARYAADRSGDGYSVLWVRGREIVHAIGVRPVTAVLRCVEDAEQFVNSAPPEVVLELLSGKAQALAMAGKPAEAENVLVQLRKRFSATSFAGYSGSLLAWGEERLRNTESFVYSRLGNYERLESAQQAASALYKHDPSNVRWPTANELNKAFCLTRGGDVTEGTALARAVIEGLPTPQHAQDIHKRAREVLNAIPQTERNKPIVNEYREWLNSTFRVQLGQPSALTAPVRQA